MAGFFETLLSVAIVAGFILIIYLKFTKKTMKEFIEELKSMGGQANARRR